MNQSNLLRPGHAVRALAFAAFVLVTVAGCKGGATKIDTLLDDPGRYDRQTVRIAGTVGNSIGVLGYGAYQLQDDTGTITVLTKEGGAPREGAEVGVEGEFRSAFTVGPQTLAVVIEDRRTAR